MYNKPQQLTSRINLAEITRDITLDPPQEVFIVEENNVHTPQVIPPTVRGKCQKCNNKYKLVSGVYLRGRI